MTKPLERQQALKDILEQRVLVLDGAMGTMIHAAPLSIETDYLGRENCPEILNVTRPDVIQDIHRAVPRSRRRYHRDQHLRRHADRARRQQTGRPRLRAQLRRRQAGARGRPTSIPPPDKPRFVAGSIGPTNKDLNITGTTTFAELRADYYLQAKGLVEGGADYLLIETCFDTGSLKAGLVAVEQLERDLGIEIPVVASVTIERTGTMLGGQPIDALYASIENHDLLAVGMNCATGPDLMTDHIRTLNEMSSHRISCYPNAGLPNAEGKFGETPESLAAQLEKFANHGWLNFVGGCCGTTPAHIRAIAQMVQGKRPRAAARAPAPRLLFGHRTGGGRGEQPPADRGRAHQRDRLAPVQEPGGRGEVGRGHRIARRQVRNGAHVIDVCLQSTDREEIEDIPPFYEKLIRKIKAPIMIDTTDPKAVELALTYCQGKSIINSVNLEDGEEKFERLCPIAKRYGAALVVGSHRRRQAAGAGLHARAQAGRGPAQRPAADREVRHPGRGHHHRPAGVPLRHRRRQLHRRRGRDHRRHPPGQGEHPVRQDRAGHLQHQLRAAGVGARSGQLGLPLPLHQGRAGPRHRQRGEAGALRVACPKKSGAWPSTCCSTRRRPMPQTNRCAPRRRIGASRPRNRRPPSISSTSPPSPSISAAPARASKQHAADLPLDQRLANYIIEGTKDGLVADLDRKRAEGATPLDIINGPLMAGMGEVGRLFNNNELIVAEVLQSAEAMKAAVNHLEQFMEKADTAARGKVDPGHGQGRRARYRQEPGRDHSRQQRLRRGQPGHQGAARRADPGLHGAQARRHRALRPAGEEHAADGDHGDRPARRPAFWRRMLVGGAALSERFTRTKIAPAYGEAVCYAKDAMTGPEPDESPHGPGGARRRAGRAHLHGSAGGGGSSRGAARRP